MQVPGSPLIKGMFWLDDVKLTLAQTAAADHQDRITLPMPVNRCSYRLDLLTISLRLPSYRPTRIYSIRVLLQSVGWAGNSQ